MPRVNFVKSARKDNPAVDKGESYYWWKFRYGGKHYSKTYPKQSQLTQSEFLSSVYAAAEMVQDFVLSDDAIKAYHDGNDDDWQQEIRSIIEDAIATYEEQGSECEDRRYNMPDHLQDAPTGELLQERADACSEIVSQLEDVVCNIEGWDESDLDGDREDTEPWQDFIDEAQAIEYEGE